MRLVVLGAVEIWDDQDHSVPLTPQLRRLLALLVTSDGMAVSADRLAEYVADGRVDGSVVRTAVSRLRKVLGERIETTSIGYRLVPGPGELDADRFAEACTRSRLAAPADRRLALTEALALWHGKTLEEFADEPWAHATATRLDELRAVATEDLAEASIESGRAADAVVLLEAHVPEQPYRERPIALLMRALAESGRTTEALRAFQRFRATLRADIGIEPTSSLRELEAGLLGGLDPEREVVASSPLRLPDGTVTFLFTDIEGSTERWQRDEVAMSAALAIHDAIIRSVVDTHGGVVFKHTGDGVCAVFTSAPAAVAAAIDVQQQLTMPVRIGIHTGEAELRDGDYFGPTMNRTARVMDAGHGGQVLVSSSTASLSIDFDLLDLGEHHLKGLTTPERLFQVGRQSFPPLRVARQRLGNIPTELTTFIGRGAEVERLAAELVDNRLVTLIGVGGTGKTRMAVEAAHALAPMFPDGCWMVELAVVSVDEAVSFAFASGLGISAGVDEDVVGDIVRRLRQKRLLLVVDNCEHVLSITADIVEQLIAECPSITIVATSREPLMVSGERLVPVMSLSTADAEQLFIERARAEAPDLVIDDSQAAAVSELCRRLDGLPLAIELAASRVRALTPVELVANLDERFRLLVGGRRSRMDRHQTMRGTLDWSYELCSDTERTVFDRLSVFPAGFDLAAARAVAARDEVSDLDVVDTVPLLVDRSLLQRSTARDGTTRFRMLETMRAYAREHLQHADCADITRECHAKYTSSAVGKLLLRSIGADEQAVRRRLLEHIPDALAALDWFIDRHDWEQAMEVAFVGHNVASRENDELFARLHQAVLASGDDVEFIDVLEQLDARLAPSEPEALANARAWRMVRAERPIPLDRFSFAPQIALSASVVTRSEAQELIAGLGRFDEAPTMVRYNAMWATLRCVIFSRHLDLVDETLERFEALVASLQSCSADSASAELCGHLAMARGDWARAATMFGKAIDVMGNERPGWFSVAVAWHSLTAKGLAGEPITGAELRDPWRWFRDELIEVLAWHGAVSSAVALDRLGHRELAERFVRWGRLADPGGVMERFGRTLGVSGLDAVSVGGAEPDELDTLIEELIVLADRLDRATK